MLISGIVMDKRAWLNKGWITLRLRHEAAEETLTVAPVHASRVGVGDLIHAHADLDKHGNWWVNDQSLLWREGETAGENLRTAPLLYCPACGAAPWLWVAHEDGLGAACWDGKRYRFMKLTPIQRATCARCLKTLG